MSTDLGPCERCGDPATVLSAGNDPLCWPCDRDEREARATNPVLESLRATRTEVRRVQGGAA